MKNLTDSQLCDAAEYCDAAYRLGINPLPALREAFGCEVAFNTKPLLEGSGIRIHTRNAGWRLRLDSDGLDVEVAGLLVAYVGFDTFAGQAGCVQRLDLKLKLERWEDAFGEEHWKIGQRVLTDGELLDLAAWTVDQDLDTEKAYTAEEWEKRVLAPLRAMCR